MNTGNPNGSASSTAGTPTAWIDALETFNDRMSRAVTSAETSPVRQAAVADLRAHLPHLTTAMLGRLADLDLAESK
ncbi:hypothetical protein [Amycolatopsis sp. WAC 01375]|uniref:hypothetical protein n=1 Tax=Amycolatopsis sp. WAC 01375 TaxID=2203194 RepID=UPI000F776FDD|nr:hypothetical protein [Amycolatopsis sp. WAC 01375]